MAPEHIDGLATTPNAGRRRLLTRWALAGLLIPISLGGLSWVGFEARMGTIFDGTANVAMFAAPLSPLLLKAFQGREVQGLTPYAVAAAVLLFNALLYLLVGLLHWRLRGQPQVNRLLWLTVVIGGGFGLLFFAALVTAFARG